MDWHPLAARLRFNGMLTAQLRRAGPMALADDATAALAREQLTFLLQLAYSGELAAAWAYVGHRRSVRALSERADIGRILRDEVRHRRNVLQMLRELGGQPDPARERKMERVGRAIAAFCQVGGWFFPMYGAGRLEAQNIREYELAARLAHHSGLHHFVEPMLEMAEVEWDHERYFRTQAMRHWLSKVVPFWPAPPPREDIRGSFQAFQGQADWAVPTVHAPLLVR